MVTDDQFIQAVRHKTIDFKPKNKRTTRALPVGKYLVITSEYKIFNRRLKIPLLNITFQSIIDAHEFCKKLIEIYGELLYILIDENYAESFFGLTQYTVENGTNIYENIQSLDGTVTRSDLAFILDE
jgi:hypothetical protein